MDLNIASTPSARSRPGQHGEPAHQREIRGFGEAVMDHLGRNLHAGFRGDEDDAAKSLVAHARPVVPGEADARQHIGGEQPLHADGSADRGGNC